VTVWVEAVPAVLAATAVLVLPGLLVALAAGLRGIAAWGTAPLLSVAMVAVTAVVLPTAGVRWGVSPVAGAVLMVIAVAAGVNWLLARQEHSAPRSDQPSSLLLAAAGLLVGAFLIARSVARGISVPTNVSQTYDAVFHLNAVRFVLDTGNASSLHIGGMARPAVGEGFYPGAWHAVVALVVDSTGTGIPMATNAVAIVVSAVVWPASALLLTRQLLGPAPAVALSAGILSAAFLALPYLLLVFGVLYPNLLAVSVLPAGLALLVSLLRRTAQPMIDSRRAGILLPVAVTGLSLAHPNAVFGLGLLGLPLILSSVAGAGARAWRRGSRDRVVGWLSAAVLVLAAGWAVLVRSRLFDVVTSQQWEARLTKPQAAGEVLLLGLLGREGFVLVALLVLAGFVVLLRTPGLRWVPVTYLLVAWFYVLAQGSDSDLSSTLTGLWYNDAYRLAALLPVLGVPLAVVGLIVPGRWLQEHAWDLRVGVRPAAVTATALVALVVATGGMYVDRLSTDISLAYRLEWDPDLSILLTRSEKDLFTSIGDYVPEGAAVAGNPWNGSALVSALGDREFVFPHLVGSWDEPREVLIEGMRDIASDPEVCAAAQELGVQYVVDGGRWIVEFDRRAARFTGFEDLSEAEGFERVVRYGETTLYRLTECAGA
jgi:hypothetical protein